MTASSSPRAIEVAAIGSGQAGDRRLFARYPLALSGELIVGDARRPCEIRDFSGSGMSLAPKLASGKTPAPQIPDALIEQVSGGIVEMLFALPGANGRVRARAFVRRITLQGNAPQFGVAFASANPDVFEALVQASDRSRLGELSKFVPNARSAPAPAHASPWQTLARYLNEVLGTCFHRCQERLHLRAQYAGNNTDPSRWYFALVALKAAEQSIRAAFLRDLLDSAYAASMDGEAPDRPPAAARGAAGNALRAGLRADALAGLDDRAMLKLIAQRNRPMHEWIAAHREAPFAPAALFGTFKRACGPAGVQGEIRDALYRTFREAVALNWPFTRRILEVSIKDELAARRKS